MTKRLYAYTLSGTFEWDDTHPDDSTLIQSFEDWMKEVSYNPDVATDFLYALGECGVEPTKYRIIEIPTETLKEIEDKIAALEDEKQKLLDSLI